MIDDDSDASPKKRPQHRHDSSDSEDEEAKQPEPPRKATTARVVVDITRARDLSEEHGMPNPFCVLSIVQLRDGRRLSDVRRTRVAKHTSNPVWQRERFIFEAPISIKELPKLRIEMFSFRTLRKARLLGKAQVALNGLEDGDNEITVPIKLDTVKAGEVCATISMTPSNEKHAAPDADSVRWFVDEEAVAPCLHREPNCLRVALVRCVELQKESRLQKLEHIVHTPCLLYTSPSPRDRTRSRMPSSA